MPKPRQYDVFLSHNSDDKAAVELLARRLRDQAGLRVFLDKWHLLPGDPWLEALEEALEASDTVAVFVGPSGVSPWQNEEMSAALMRAVRTHDEYRVIPVLLPKVQEDAVATFLARRTWVDFRAGLDDEEAFQRLVALIKGEAIVAGDYELPDEPAPYRGLLPFEEKHARFFFGRVTDVRGLVERLSQQNFVAVVGASGSGKSSLVRAGLLPALARDALTDSHEWHTLVFTPGSEPLRALAEQLAVFVPPPDRLQMTDDLTQRLAERADGLRTAAGPLFADRPRPLLLIVDQFEEVFTLCPDDLERCRSQIEQFVANLADAVQHGNGSIRVLITVRADFTERCLAFAVLRGLLQDRGLLLGPLDEAALREAIVRPAQEVGAFLEKGLLNAILRDVTAEPGSLPLLQHALYELWQARRGPWLTLNAYETSGGVNGALQRRAQATYDALTPYQQPLARNIFLRLIALVEGVHYTRRRVPRAELYPAEGDPAQVDLILQKLSGEQARLIVADEQSVELAHEALIQHWERLRGWLAEDRAALLIHRDLTKTAIEWDEHGRDSSYLYRGTRLVAVEQWSKTHGTDLNRLEQEFLKSSTSARRRVRAQRISVGVVATLLALGVLLLMIAGLGPFASRIDWSPVPDFAETEVSALAWGADGTMYVGLGEGDYPSSLARSRDAGITWEFLDLKGDFVWSLLPDPYKVDVIYASLGTDGLFRSQDGGDSWVSVSEGLPMSEVDALAVSHTGVLYAGDFTQRIGVYASRDQGATWFPVLGSPAEAVFCLGWMDNELLVGTDQGLWQWTEDGQWVHLLDPHMPIYSVVGIQDVIFAGGEDGIYRLREDAAPRKISPEEIINMDVVVEDVPHFVAGTIDGSVLQWQLDETQVEVIAYGTELSGSSYVYVIRAQWDGRMRLWAGAENGLHRAEWRRWYELPRN